MYEEIHADRETHSCMRLVCVHCIERKNELNTCPYTEL